MRTTKQLAPFIHTDKTAPYIYLTQVVALLPCCFFAIFYYGVKAFILLLTCALVFTITDNTSARLVRRDEASGNYFDFNSIVSGLAFGLMLPPGTSLWVAIIGVVFGSLVVKQFFGGAGNNILNPACAARLFVGLCCSSKLTGFIMPGTLWFSMSSLISFAPTVSLGDNTSNYYFTELICGRFPGYMGMSCILLILVGGVYMLIKGTVRLYAAVSYIIGIAVFYPLFTPEFFQGKQGVHDFVIFMITSGVVYVAVFMLGDYTTMPSRFIPSVFAGILCSFLTILIKGKVSLDVMLCAPVLTVNFLSFVIDYFSKCFSRRKRQFYGEDSGL